MILLVNSLNIYIVIDFSCIFLNLLTNFLVSFILQVLHLKIFKINNTVRLLITLIRTFFKNEIVFDLLLI